MSHEWEQMYSMTEGKVNQSAPQVSMKAGLGLFGKASNAAVKSEIGTTTQPKGDEASQDKEYTPAQRQEALAYLMFYKQKLCGKVKARGCADGWKQHTKIPCHESASPTMAPAYEA